MRQADPVAVLGPHAEDVAHHVDLEDVKILVDRGEEEGLELVRAGLDFVAVGLLGVGEGIVGFRFGFGGRAGVCGWAEAEGGGRRVEETLLDAIDGTLGEDVDAVDYVVE